MDSNTICLNFQSITLVGELKPFPVVYVALDPNVVEVWLKVFVTDSQIKGGLTIENVKKILTKLIRINEWEQERDITMRQWELYGICKLLKVRQ